MSSATPIADRISQNIRDKSMLDNAEYARPKRTRIITVANQKGGVGKTTTTVNLAAALATAGLRVIVIDIDPQGNASTALGVDHSAGIPSTYSVLTDGAALVDCLATSPELENLWVCPATIDLAGVDIELRTNQDKDHLLSGAVQQFLATHRDVDVILIDCPPALGTLTLNAFVAAHEVLVPIQCEYYALEGLSQLWTTIQMVGESLNQRLSLSTILLTMFDQRTRLSQDVAQEVRQVFAQQTLNTVIPRTVRIAEAPSYGKTVVTYDPSGTGSLAYRKAALELTQRWQSEESK